MKTPLERFLKYATVETTSSEETDVAPSSPTQFNLAKILVEELKEIGLDDAKVDEHCYVTATLPTNVRDRAVPTVGFIAHLDTSCAASGADVKPKVIRYEGGDVLLDSGAVIPQDAELAKLVGRELVVSDGTTLLGADDKAGIAAIMAALDRLVASDEPRANIRVCFTPDEEIGNGTAFFNLDEFAADCAYTVDGGPAPEINCETFTADKAIIVVEGFDVHPGEAKDTMINASRILANILAKLPAERAPETTEGREPFIHLYKLEGGVSIARAELLLRSFDEDERKKNKDLIEQAVDAAMANVSNAGNCRLTFDQQYLNMGYFLTDYPQVTQTLFEAARLSGYEPIWVPIRGGTDGSRLTEMGLPTPNIFTGGRNFHSTLEYLDVQDHEGATNVVYNLARLWSELTFEKQSR